MEDNKYASRKFLIFLLTDLALLSVLWYCIYTKSDEHIVSILMTIVTIVGTYAGVNVGEKTLPSIVDAIKTIKSPVKEENKP